MFSGGNTPGPMDRRCAWQPTGRRSTISNRSAGSDGWNEPSAPRLAVAPGYGRSRVWSATISGGVSGRL
jgi:hypothetical protein